MVSHVVNREDHRQLLHRGVFFVLRSQQYRHQRGLPVVAMNYIGLPNILGEFDGRSAELRKALGVVRIILACHAIEMLALEILGVFHKKIPHATQSAAV